MNAETLPFLSAPWQGPRASRNRWLSLSVVILLFMGILAALFWDRIFIVVRSGEGGVYWNRFTGTRIDLV